MLRVIETHDRNQQWIGVADIMKAEAHEEANASLDKYATRANGIAGITAERVVREGATADEILGLIEDDEDIAILVLAAGTGKDGPGPLVAGFGGNAGRLSDPGRHRAGASERRRARRDDVARVACVNPGARCPPLSPLPSTRRLCGRPCCCGRR